MSKIGGMADRIPAEVAMGDLERFVANGQRAAAAIGGLAKIAQACKEGIADSQEPSGAHGSASPTSKPRALNPTRFLCRSEVRNFLLAYAKEKRTHKFARVSEETLIEINEQVRAILIARVGRLPSKGKTI